jgi:hypothetical protein
VGALVFRAVAVVLHRDLGERLAPEAVGVHVAVRREREEPGRRVAAREQRVAEPRDAAPAAVFQLLGADHEHDVVDARGDREAAVAEGVGAGGAVVLDAGDRPPVEPERVGERDRGLASARAGQVGAEIGRLDLRGVDASVGVRLEGRIADELLVGAVVPVPELRAAHPDDGDLVLHDASIGLAFQK